MGERNNKVAFIRTTRQVPAYINSPAHLSVRQVLTHRYKGIPFIIVNMNFCYLTESTNPIVFKGNDNEVPHGNPK
ncbi:hypothetical protein PITCH_A110002 [uncultured Desulfobacterium sp.]|uniref:Uncharacterized protein n=1 Tax=uncultured Desulfobacterium sp. TaxID=201089 RepID=A0A445MR17_9BACT|nr:hypothetical protein PITCH_A110002 [uncultured Desulfobacterium sp.]